MNKTFHSSQRLSGVRVPWLLIVWLASMVPVFAQTSQTLEEIKIAADAGDAAAQAKLAEQYIMRLDTKQAEAWYRKSAAQGYGPAQAKLGNMLLMRSKTTVGLKPDAKAALAQEGFKWALLAANQGEPLGQADVASVYLEGKLVQQDYIEAYKWSELAAQEKGLLRMAAISGESIKKSAILKMNADQIAEAKRRVAEFRPTSSSKTELPKPAWTSKIKLQGISGTEQHRFAVINGKTFEKGDEEIIKINGEGVKIHCVDIKADSATISMDGVEGTQEIRISKD